MESAFPGFSLRDPGQRSAVRSLMTEQPPNTTKALIARAPNAGTLPQSRSPSPGHPIAVHLTASPAPSPARASSDPADQ
jgi:hypothetical protein